MKKVLILTAGFGEGHNSAARGIRDGLVQIAANEVEVELHDLFQETYRFLNDWVRAAYMSMIDHAPFIWARVYKWLDQKNDFHGSFDLFFPVKIYLRRMLARLQPDVVVSVYPAYSHLLDDVFGPKGGDFRRVIVVTDSITINGIWFRCSADYLVLPNELTAKVLGTAGVATGKIKTLGFPVSPRFANVGKERPLPSEQNGRRVLYIINSAKSAAPDLVRRLAELPGISLTVTVGRSRRLWRAIEKVRTTCLHPFELISWSDELPRLLRATHLLISKAGGATVQEAIAAACPLIINRIVPGQEEGNARLVMETGSGTVAPSHDAVVAAVQAAFANEGAIWREWSANIQTLSRPDASLRIAEFLLSI
ncbi:MAG: hypothetical protein ABI871_05275 [Chthoniobacterales bacterium]